MIKVEFHFFLKMSLRQKFFNQKKDSLNSDNHFPF
jgi:hypothetical protein